MSDAAAFSRLLSPTQVGGREIQNRLFLTTHNPKMSERRYLGYLETRAASGLGMISVPILHEAVSSLSFVPPIGTDSSYAADPDSSPDPESDEGRAYFDATLMPMLTARAEIAHKYGALCFGQVASRGSVRLPDTLQAMPSPSGVVDPQVRIPPHVLSPEEIRREVRLFARSAGRIQRSGLDGTEIHAAHGYLVEQFLSPVTNKRTDEYGGSAAGRLRFLREIIAAIREECGERFLIGLRISGYEQYAGGLDTADVSGIVAAVQSDLAYVNITAGTIGALGRGVTVPYVASSYYAPGFNVDAARKVKEIATVPISVTGRMNNPELMEQVLRDGYADIIGVTRTLIADPEFIVKVREGRSEQIHRCIGINECHFPDRVSSCPVNPRAGREKELAVRPAARRKRVLVVGGGPAGLQAARTAALRGHDVTLVEKGSELGGKVTTLAQDEARREFSYLIAGLSADIERAGVDVRLNTEATAEFVTEFGGDAVILATGAVPAYPDIDGLDDVVCTTALDLVRDIDKMGDRVLVVGGLNDHLAPLVAAEYLADRGKEVVLISENVYIGQGLEWSILHLMLKRLLEKHVDLQPLTEIVRAGRRPEFENTFTKDKVDLGEFDSAVFASNMQTVDFPDIPGEVYRIGDCLAPRRIVHAALDGARAGSQV